MARGRSTSNRVSKANGFFTIAIAMVFAALLTSGCNGDKKKSGTKQMSIQEIEKKYKSDRQEQTEKLIKAARSAHDSADVIRAEEAIEAAAEAAEKVTGAEKRANIFRKLASAEYRLGEKSAAKKSLNKAIDAIDELDGKAEIQANLHIELAEMLESRKQKSDSAEQLEAAEEKVAKIEAIDGKILVLAKAATVFAELKDADEAKRVIGEAKKITDAMEEKSLGKAVAIADIAAAQNAYDKDEAKKSFKEALAVAESIEQDYVQANAKFRIAKKMVDAGEKSAAKKLLVKTKEQSNKIKDNGQRKEVLREIDSLLTKLEKKKK